MILVCGQALIDLFLGPLANGRLPAEALTGGSPFNQAVGLARLGRPVGFLSKLSTDSLGDALVRTLAENGVALDWLVRSPLLTTISVVAVGADGQPRYSFHGAGAADRSLTADELPAELPDAVTALVFGCYSLGVDPTAATLETLMRREAGRRVIAIDPNVRAALIGGADAWRPRFEAMLPHVDIAKASTEDLEQLYPGAALADIAAAWQRLGPRLVVVTRGAQGAIGFLGGEAVERPARPVTVVDTVGAGDAFHAALLARLDERDGLTRGAVGRLTKDDMADAIDYAIRAAALACSRRGADLPRHADLVEPRA